MKKFGFLLFTVSVLSFWTVGALATQLVDTLLVVAVDVSNSIDKREYELQKNGVLEALSDPGLMRTLRACNSLGVALTYVEWAGHVDYREVKAVVPWTLVKDSEDMVGLANEIAFSERSFQGDTDIASALHFAYQQVQNAPFASQRKIIVMSGDGTQSNSHRGFQDLIGVKAQIMAAGDISVHGLTLPPDQAKLHDKTPLHFVPVVVEGSDIEDFYNEYVKVGPHSKVIRVESFREYGQALKEQLFRALNNCFS